MRRHVLQRLLPERPIREKYNEASYCIVCGSRTAYWKLLMKFPRPPDFETMPMDGWIKLRPGEVCLLAIDTPTRPSLQELRNKMQAVRGMVLAAGFTVENNLVLVQLADAFGTTDRKQGGARFGAQEDYLRAETTGVERRSCGGEDGHQTRVGGGARRCFSPRPL
jgi:hypothetical protein